MACIREDRALRFAVAPFPFRVVMGFALSRQMMAGAILRNGVSVRVRLNNGRFSAYASCSIKDARKRR
jgi:hypothetical protein